MESRSQRLTEWLDTPKIDYHERQAVAPYRSTICFCNWLERIGYINRDSELDILDLGCGLGGNLVYMGRRYPKCYFVGLDINPKWYERGNSLLECEKVDNAHIETGDWYNLPESYISKFDAVISYQTLSWLPSFDEPLERTMDLNPKWFALTSLFHEGLVSCNTETQTYDENMGKLRNLYYNVYSLPVVDNFLAKRGYKMGYEKFNIDIDIPDTGEFRSHTEKLQDGRRIIISGPVYEPWYFISATR